MQVLGSTVALWMVGLTSMKFTVGFAESPEPQLDQDMAPRMSPHHQLSAQGEYYTHLPVPPL